MATDRRPLISVVTPCYNEEENVEECYRALKSIVEEKLPRYDYEHIFCDNCSTDETPKILRRLAAADHRVKVIFNSRNFGPFRSLFNGVISTSGDAVLVFLPADLQDPPELLPEMLAKWEQGHQVVYGIRKQRQESVIMRAVRKVYYRLVSRLANIKIPVDVGEFQFVDKAVIEALRKCDDYYPYLRGMIAHCGFSAVGVEYTWRGRQRGFSKNRLYHLIDQGLNGLISFTNLPMRLGMGIGITIAAFSLTYAAFSLIFNLVYYRQVAPPGIPTLIVAVFFFSGVQLFFLGFIGEYIAAIHFQVRKRPLVVERERLNFGPDAEGSPEAQAPLGEAPPH